MDGKRAGPQTAGENKPGAIIALAGKYELILLLGLALLLSRVPLLGNFLSWQMTFFHEISHGLAALAGGGSIGRIELRLDGSGLCYTSGGLGWLVSWSGYAGAALWGVFICLLSGAAANRRAYLLAAALSGGMLASALMWARDLQSWLIISLLAVWYGLAVRLRDRLPLRLILKLSGLYILLDALRAPLALFGHRQVNDAASLAAQTGLPAFFWIIMWLMAAAAALFLVWKMEKPGRLTITVDRRTTGPEGSP